jgi:hypothetical protein
MEEQSAMLGIRVTVGPSADAEDVAEATLQLRRELLDLDVDAVELVSAGEPPPGSRAVELAALGALVVTVAQSQLLALWWLRSGHGWPARSGAASSLSSAAMSWS